MSYFPVNTIIWFLEVETFILYTRIILTLNSISETKMYYICELVTQAF